MNDHISNKRRKESQEKILAKINILEAYLIKGIPENVYIPTSETSFRLWEDSALNLQKIGSPNTLNKRYNKQFKQRINELINELKKRKNRKEQRTNIVKTLQAEIKEKDRLISDLAGQWHSTKQELETLKLNERRLLNRIEELKEINAKLTRQVNTIIPIK
jgi:septal ring factor EnvC (AmiA/AmiB activator)